MTINERIKELRKKKGWNQTQLASTLGVTQSGVSYMERNGSSIADSTIKAICSVCGVNEEWLRYGTEPMFAKQSQFSLDDYVKDREMSELEKEIICAYFELEPDIRKALLEHFKTHLMGTISAETRSQHEARLLREEADAVERGNGKSSVLPSTKDA